MTGVAGVASVVEVTADLRVLSLPVYRLHVDELNPRQRPGDLGDLTASVRRVGVHTPLQVRSRAAGGWGVLSGSRRLAAARTAGLEAVPCIVRDELTDEEAAVLALAENVGRDQLNPVDEAWGYWRLVKGYGLTQVQAAERCGVSGAKVNQYLAVLELDPGELERLAAGEMPLHEAHALAVERRRERRGGAHHEPARCGKWWLPPERQGDQDADGSEGGDQGVDNPQPAPSPPEPEHSQTGNGVVNGSGPDRIERRRLVVAELVRQRPVAKAADLIPLLAERGFQACEATVWGDLKALGATKVEGAPGGDGDEPQDEPQDEPGDRHRASAGRRRRPSRSRGRTASPRPPPTSPTSPSPSRARTATTSARP